MKSNSHNYSSKGVFREDYLKKYADRAMKDIISKNTHIQDISVHIEPESKKKGVFKATFKSVSHGRVLVLRKSGRNIYRIINILKRKIIRKSRDLNKYKNKINLRRRGSKDRVRFLEEAS